MKGGTRKRGKTWSYYFDAAQIGGKRKKIEKGGFRTKKEAETALTKALADYENGGMTFTPVEISVSDYLDFWYDNYCVPNLTENSLRRYKSTIKNHLKPAFGAYHLKALQAASVQEFVTQLKAKNLSKATIQNTVSVLSAALDYAIHPMQYIRENPCRLIRIGAVQKQKKETATLRDEDFQKILDRFPIGSRHRMYLLLGWHRGLRIGECAGLSWDDIDFDTRTLSINRQASLAPYQERRCWVFKEPKHHSFRTVKFGDTLCREQLGIPFSHHSLRHTHATKLVGAGANIKAVQIRLGHKDIATTMGIYVHHTDDMAQEAVDLFENTINKNATSR